MRTVKEMVRLGMNRNSVEDFLGRACAESFKCLYPGLKCRRGHLSELRVVGRVNQVRAYKGLNGRVSQQGIVSLRQGRR